MLKADALLALDRQEEATTAIAEAAALSEGVPIATSAEIERVTGKALARAGQPAAARGHFERALRILDVVGNVHARAKAAADAAAALPPDPSAEGIAATEPAARVSASVGDAAALFEVAATPELFAREAFALVDAAGCARHLVLFATQTGRPITVLACSGCARDAAAAYVETDATPVALGTSRQRNLFLSVEPAGDLRSRSLAIAVRKLIGMAQTLEAFRGDERRRASLWPADAAATQDDGVYVSDQTVNNLAIARRIAPSPVPVLITGETGTGKEVLARAIHRHSERREGPFLPFNCQAVPRDMVDSQLFGYRRGAFTGAHEPFPGVIRAAAGGTLFLDEIGELDADVQPKLLRFIDTCEIHPLGEPHPVKVDVRVIAATNAEIDRYVDEGRFREDLFYRLNVVRLRIPPLRDRREEIPPLIQQFLHQYADEAHKGTLRLADETLEYLLLYHWPGNVRHLANEMRRLATLADADAVLLPDDLSPEIRAARRTVAVTDQGEQPPGEDHTISVGLDQSLAQAVAQLERVMISRALATAGGHVERAARMLKISRKGLFLKRRRLGMDSHAVA